MLEEYIKTYLLFFVLTNDYRNTGTRVVLGVECDFTVTMHYKVSVDKRSTEYREITDDHKG